MKKLELHLMSFVVGIRIWTEAFMASLKELSCRLTIGTSETTRNVSQGRKFELGDIQEQFSVSY